MVLGTVLDSQIEEKASRIRHSNAMGVLKGFLAALGLFSRGLSEFGTIGRAPIGPFWAALFCKFWSFLQQKTTKNRDFPPNSTLQADPEALGLSG